MASPGIKRGYDESGDTPTKRLKQTLHDGYIKYGQEWADQVFLQGIFLFADIELDTNELTNSQRQLTPQ